MVPYIDLKFSRCGCKFHNSIAFITSFTTEETKSKRSHRTTNCKDEIDPETLIASSLPASPASTFTPHRQSKEYLLFKPQNMRYHKFPKHATASYRKFNLLVTYVYKWPLPVPLIPLSQVAVLKTFLRNPQPPATLPEKTSLIPLPSFSHSCTTLMAAPFPRSHWSFQTLFL